MFQVDASTNAIKGISDAGGLRIAPTQLAVAGGSAWLGNDQGPAYRFAPGAITGEATRFRVKSPGFLWPVAAAGSLWVSCCRLPPALLRVDPATGRVLARIERVGRVVASGTGFLWASDRDEGPRLVRIDTETYETVPIGALGFLWTDLTVADGAVWASSPQDNSIVRLDPFTGDETERIRVEGSPGALTAGAGGVWAAIGENGAVARYALETGRIDTIDVGGTPSDLVFAHDSIWVTVSDEPPTEARPGVSVIDQVFVDSINGCERLVVTRREVKAALGFRAEDPAPTRSADGAFFGCKYAASFDMRQGGGQVVITAYEAGGGGPPIPLDGSRPVRGIGDEAEFTPLGNADGHVDGPRGATSMLRARSGELTLRFDGGVFDPAERSWAPYGLRALRQLAEYAFDTLEPAEPQPDVPGSASRPFFLDLRTGEQTPLAKSLAGGTNFAASRDGTRLAFVESGVEGSPQIFIARTDGAGVRQMTHDPTGAAWPAWSPDGTVIAYKGNGSDLFVLDVATGESRRIIHGANRWTELQFTPDGSSLVYTGGSDNQPLLLTVPVAGGRSTMLFGDGRGGMGDAGNGSLSPDGSLVTMMGSRVGGPGAIRFVANVDGTELRDIPGRGSDPAGTWSLDGRRIVCSDGSGGVLVVDIGTGDASRVALGSAAIWLDRHTLLVEL